MPIYEFKCQECGRLTSVFVRSVGAPNDATCQHCGGRRLERVISRFAYHKSEQAILDEYGSEPKRLGFFTHLLESIRQQTQPLDGLVISIHLDPKLKQGVDLARLTSRVAVMRSEESRLGDLASDAGLADLDERDPRSLARWARRMGREMGEELGPEFDEVVERLEAGEMPGDMDDGGGGEPLDDFD